jgi:Cu+-exporting ATPase
MKKTYSIKGMHCMSCKKIIEMELEDKVNKISIDVNSGKVEIDFSEDKISEKEIIEKITKLGYKVLK